MVPREQRAESMKKIAIITARGGSKRIPRKNIKNFCGRPIIAYSIETALESGLFDEVMVSTDDEEIAEIARSYGAAVPFMRSKATSSDYATTADVIVEVLKAYEEKGEEFEVLCCLYPTAPFISAEELVKAWNIIESGAPSVIPVTDFDFPPQRGFGISEDGSVFYAYPEYAFSRSQDLPRMVHDCGRFFMVSTEVFLAHGTAVLEGCRSLYIDPRFVQDIDTLQDWELAEMKYQIMKRKEGRPHAAI